MHGKEEVERLVLQVRSRNGVGMSLPRFRGHLKRGQLVCLARRIRSRESFCLVRNGDKLDFHDSFDSIEGMVHPFIRNLFRLTQCLLVAALLLWPVSAPSDQAQYFYDELGRLVGVVDGQGNVAVYNYDEVGNLLSIERFTTGTTGIGIFPIAPSSTLIGTDVEIRGFGFSARASEDQEEFNGTTAAVVSQVTKVETRLMDCKI